MALADFGTLLRVFTRSHEGRLDRADARWADVRVLAAGQARAPNALGIFSIALIAGRTADTFSDASALHGTARFNCTATRFLRKEGASAVTAVTRGIGWDDAARGTPERRSD